MSAGRGGRGQQPAPPAVDLRSGDGAGYAETTLESGIRVLTEHMPSVRSVSVGVWVRQGGAHEAEPELGVSHLLEHMVFKGTRHRSAAEIAASLERLGGSLDAYTSREHTAYQARVLDAHLGEAMDVLADLVLHPTLAGEDLELEREVVLEEIAQVEDTPEDLVFELHGERMWRGHPYGRPILGRKATVRALGAGDLRRLQRARYRGQNLVVAAAGHVRHEEVVAQAERLFRDAAGGEPPPPLPPPPEPAGGEVHEVRDGAQTHIVFGIPTPGRRHPDRYALTLVSQALGGGMSSRLFQRIREEMGLCYSVYSYQSFYAEAGTAGVYVGTRPATADAAVAAVREELERLARDGLSPEELDDVRRQVKGQVMLSLESTGSRVYRLAASALAQEDHLTLDELLARLDAVTLDDAMRVARQVWDPERHFVLRLGPERAGDPVPGGARSR